MKPVLIACALLLVGGAALAEDAVTFPVPGGTGHGVLFTPTSKPPYPAILVVHDRFGLDGWTLKQARALSGDFIVLAIDLYGGKTFETAEDGQKMAATLERGRVLGDLKAAVEFLKQRPGLKKGKVGALGFSLGGTYVLALAAEGFDLETAISYDGRPPVDPKAISRIKSPILGNYGMEDDAPTPEEVRAFEAALQKADKRVDIKIYPKAGHAFSNPLAPWGGYEPRAARDAWQRTLASVRMNMLVDKR